MLNNRPAALVELTFFTLWALYMVWPRPVILDGRPSRALRLLDLALHRFAGRPDPRTVLAERSRAQGAPAPSTAPPASTPGTAVNEPLTLTDAGGAKMRVLVLVAAALLALALVPVAITGPALSVYLIWRAWPRVCADVTGFVGRNVSRSEAQRGGVL